MRVANRRSFLIVALAFPLVTSVHFAMIATGGSFPEEETRKLYEYIEVLLLVVWIGSDPELPAEHRPTVDHGMLLWVTFPFLAAYHQYVSHRWKGVLVVLGLTLLLFAPYVVWAIVAFG